MTSRNSWRRPRPSSAPADPRVRVRLNPLIAALGLLAWTAVAFAAAGPLASLPGDERPQAPVQHPYPGTLTLFIDATDVSRAIFRGELIVPSPPAGPLTIFFPRWVPGHHAPSGPISRIAGIEVNADGVRIPWRRDPVMMHALHMVVPAGTRDIRLGFQYLSATGPDMGRVEMSEDMMDLQWTSLAPYPAGHASREMTVRASVRLPPGWAFATALEQDDSREGVVRFRPVSYETLVDSPIVAGRYHRSEPLGELQGAPVMLELFADRPESLQARPDQIAAHRALVEQADRLFRSRHFERYAFLVGLTSRIGSLGAEHLRSSENFTVPGYFTDWADTAPSRELLPHELAHSWNGKFRRGSDLLTQTLDVPMRNSLLWVYEGLTRYLGAVLAARAGLHTMEESLGNFAQNAAAMQNRPGRAWRALLDTTNHSIYAEGPQPWPSWQRGADYYLEGQLVWLDIDTRLREMSGGQRSLDDFVRAFFAVEDRSTIPLAYDFDDVVRTLNRVAPGKWREYLRQRIDQVAPDAPLDGIRRGGYRLVYRDTPTGFFRSGEKQRGVSDLGYSVGLTVKGDGTIAEVLWGSTAYDAALTIGTRIVAVGAHTFTPSTLLDAVRECRGRETPLPLTVQRADAVRQVALNCSAGLRYPWLERDPSAADRLGAILAPLPRAGS